MTLVQMQRRSANAEPAHRTVDHAMEAAGAAAEHARGYRKLTALPVVDGQGSAPGILALAR
ncbi:hypothetical protein [Streptomyces sp. NPDC003952]